MAYVRAPCAGSAPPVRVPGTPPLTPTPSAPGRSGPRRGSCSPAGAQGPGSLDGGGQLVGLVDNEARPAVVDHLGDTPPPERHHRGATRHGFDYHDAEGLFPADGEQQRFSAHEQLAPGRGVSFADVFGIGPRRGCTKASKYSRSAGSWNARGRHGGRQLAVTVASSGASSAPASSGQATVSGRGLTWWPCSGSTPTSPPGWWDSNHRCLRGGDGST